VITQANALQLPLADGVVQTCITSPPYWGLRDYGEPNQLGLEHTPEEYVDNMVTVFREVWRVLRPDGTLWLNLGDSYSGSGKGRNSDGTHQDSEGWKQGTSRGTIEGHLFGGNVPTGLKPKDLCGIPWRVAFALQADGWYLRSDIIWHKPNPMPESVTDRPTKAHEYVFLLSKKPRYYYDADAIREPHTWVENRPSGMERNAEAYREKVKHSNNKYGGGGSGFQGHSGSTKADGTSLNHPGGRNKRTVWSVTTHSYSGAHYATFPPDLVRPMVLAGAPAGGLVLDPFCGSGTVGEVCRMLPEPRHFIGFDISHEYLSTQAIVRSEQRTPAKLLKDLPMFAAMP